MSAHLSFLMYNGTVNLFATKRDSSRAGRVYRWQPARLQSPFSSKFSIDGMQWKFPLFYTPSHGGIIPELSPITLIYKTRLFIG